MLIRRVIHDEIENDSYSSFFSLGYEAVEIGERPVCRVNIFIIGDVVTEIHLRRRKARRNPDSVNAERLQIVELRGDAVEIAEAVVVAIGVAARINLVENRVLPPLMALGINRFLRPRPRNDDRQTDEES